MAFRKAGNREHPGIVQLDKKGDLALLGRFHLELEDDLVIVAAHLADLDLNFEFAVRFLGALENAGG